MRISLITIAAGLLAACSTRHLPAADGARAAVACQDEDSSPRTLRDADIRRELTRALEGLRAAGATSTLEALHEQLDRKACELGLAPVRGDAFRAAELHAHALASTVIVGKLYKCDHCPKWHLSTATGFFVSEDGAFVTSRHVIEDDKDVSVAIMGADGEVHPVVEVLAADRDSDVAILRAKLDRPVAPLPLRAGIAVAEPVHVLSHPASTYWYYTAGMVSRRFERQSGGRAQVELLDITADFARGSSGAPVLDERGNVVGVVRSTRSIYYDDSDDRPRSLQMVLKQCAPAEGVLQLVE